MFSGATFFRGAISKWDVSNVRDMSSMFLRAQSFNGDLSKWDVSSVTNMPGMFHYARSFNGDISTWDVSSVNSMDHMFRGAMLFKRKLCGSAWVYSKSRKNTMFAGSLGSISKTVCTTTSAFSPQSRVELKDAVDEYAKLSPKDDCSDCRDVSRFTEMPGTFDDTRAFNYNVHSIKTWSSPRTISYTNTYNYKQLRQRKKRRCPESLCGWVLLKQWPVWRKSWVSSCML